MARCINGVSEINARGDPAMGSNNQPLGSRNSSGRFMVQKPGYVSDSIARSAVPYIFVLFSRPNILYRSNFQI